MRATLAGRHQSKLCCLAKICIAAAQYNALLLLSAIGPVGTAYLGSTSTGPFTNNGCGPCRPRLLLVCKTAAIVQHLQMSADRGKCTGNTGGETAGSTYSEPATNGHSGCVVWSSQPQACPCVTGKCSTGWPEGNLHTQGILNMPQTHRQGTERSSGAWQWACCGERCTDLLLLYRVAALRKGRPPSERIYEFYSRKPEDSRCACQSAAGESPRSCSW
jgi:hypothetical protein